MNRFSNISVSFDQGLGWTSWKLIHRLYNLQLVVVLAALPSTIIGILYFYQFLHHTTKVHYIWAVDILCKPHPSLLFHGIWLGDDSTSLLMLIFKVFISSLRLLQLYGICVTSFLKVIVLVYNLHDYHYLKTGSIYVIQCCRMNFCQTWKIWIHFKRSELLWILSFLSDIWFLLFSNMRL